MESLKHQVDQALAWKQGDVRAAEDSLAQALFLLGEDVYTQRIAATRPAPFHPGLEHARCGRRPPSVLDEGGQAATLRRFLASGD